MGKQWKQCQTLFWGRPPALPCACRDLLGWWSSSVCLLGSRLQSRKQPATCPGPEWPLRGRDPTGDGHVRPPAVPHQMGTGLHTLILSGSLTHTVPAPQFGGDFGLRDPGAPPPSPTSPDNVHGCGPRLEEVRGLVHLRHAGKDPLPGTLEGRAVRTSPQAQKAAPGAAWPQAGLSPPGFAAPRAGWSLGDHLPPSAWPQALMPLGGRTQQRKEGQGTPGEQNHSVPEARTYGLRVCTPRSQQNTHPVHARPHHSSPPALAWRLLRACVHPGLRLGWNIVRAGCRWGVGGARGLGFPGALPQRRVVWMWFGSSLAFCMMYSAYKLNKQGNNIQP